jgi:predicted P-loop ATPase/GTPase
MRVLVVGADRVDAGKTTISTGLLERLGGVGFKPRAGNDYWFDHDDYRRAVGAGRLYGKDAKRLAAASAPDTEPEAINPVHRLWRPAPGADTGMLGRAGRQFVLDRVGESFVVNENADVPASARESLPLDDAVAVETLEELNEQMWSRHRPALAALGEEIEGQEPLVVESYGDTARPLESFVADAVAAVEPGRVRVYDGERYDRACEAVGGSVGGQLEETVGDALGYLDPLATVPLPALGSEARRDPKAVAGAYADAYDAVLGAMG